MASHVRWYIVVLALALLIGGLVLLILRSGLVGRGKEFDLGEYILSSERALGDVYPSSLPSIVYGWRRGETGWVAWEWTEATHKETPFLPAGEDGFGLSLLELSERFFQREAKETRRFEVIVVITDSRRIEFKDTHIGVTPRPYLNIDGEDIKLLLSTGIPWGRSEIRAFEYRRGMGRLALAFVERRGETEEVSDMALFVRKPDDFPDHKGKFPWE